MKIGDRISELYKGEIFSAETQYIGRQRINWMCQQVEGQKVVDIGCSQGIVSILLAREGFQVVGVDNDVEAIEYANSDRAKESPEMQQRLTFIRGDICDVDLPDREFHTAIMGEFLEHQIRPDKAIIRAYELLVDDGKLIITVPFGLDRDPDHKQTFYMATLYKLIYPHFVITGVEIIGRYLCLLCKRRKVVLEKQIDGIDLALVERAEREFQNREVVLTAELNTTKVELSKEQRALQAVRASLPFQLGSILVQAVRNPGRNTILLPYRVFRLGVRALRKQPLISAPALVAKKAHILETIKQRVNEIKQEMGSAAIYSVEPLRKDLKIAVIMDDVFYELFKYEANLIAFTPYNWRQVLSENRPGLLLVDSAWRGIGDSWRLQLVNLKQKPDSKVPELVLWCKTRDIPTAFWNREDSLHYEEFVDTARLFDYVFTTDADCIARYKKDLGHDNVFCLPFAAQPRIHNPVGSTRKIRDVGFAGSWYAKGHDDRVKQMKYVLKPVLAYDVDIFDRNYSRNDADFRFPEKYEPYIVGELGYEEMVYAYKMYKLFLNVNSVQESPTMFAMRVPEILASGTCVLSGYSRGIENLIGSDIVKMTSSPDQTRSHLDLLLGDKELRDRLAHLGLRKVMREHTYGKRLDYILQTMDIGKGKGDAGKKGVSVITCTNKLIYMDNIFANYERQEYEDRELIIILNDDRLNLEEWKEKAQGYSNVAVYQIDEKEPLGACLNYGVEKARFGYISKFDDDNYYGPAFLEDLMNAFEYTDADIVGKYAAYIYFENGDILALYGEDVEHCYTDFVAVSAMILRREVFNKVRFSSDMSTGEDTQFLWECVNSGFRIYAADRFNYVDVRRPSPEPHARRIEDEEKLAQCRIVSHTKDYATHVTC